jgi:hypothetical protein
MLFATVLTAELFADFVKRVMREMTLDTEVNLPDREVTASFERK